jgi:hypothetical protein
MRYSQADRAIMDLAERQHGVVSRAQVLAAGVPAGVLSRRVLTPMMRLLIGGAASGSTGPGRCRLMKSRRWSGFRSRHRNAHCSIWRRACHSAIWSERSWSLWRVDVRRATGS